MFFEEVVGSFALSEMQVGYGVRAFGDRAVLIEGQKSICVMSDDTIRFKTNNSFVTIEGEDLKLIDLTNDQASVVGRIKNIAFGV